MTKAERSFQPLLTVAIPTYNRAGYLRQNLAQLRSEMASVPPGVVEVLVSDNCSPDETPDVVAQARAAGLDIEYIRNAENLGWGRNFAQCFDRARGKHVLLLGDDDMFLDGALSLLVARLTGHEYGVVLLRPYGFDVDFRAEFPGGTGRERRFTDANEFLVAIGALMTLTSSCVLNKSLMSEVNSGQFSSGDLGALHLVLRAALAARENLFLDQYLIAGKRQNSFNYEYAVVFVGEMWRIIDAHRAYGLSDAAIRRMERDMLLSYYPFYMLDLRWSGRGDLAITADECRRRFGRSLLYRVWLKPIITWPRAVAIAWGVGTTVIGRALGGEVRRGLTFAASRVRRRLSPSNTLTKATR